MSKKTIPFKIPNKSADDTSTPAPTNLSSLEETGVDRWVRQPKKPAKITADPAKDRETAAVVTITISAEPDWFEAIKIGFLLPPLAVWFWTLGAAQRNLQLFTR
jgi:hypothetical protein